MKLSRFTILIFLLIFLMTQSLVTYASEYDVSPSDLIAEAAILINQTTGQVLLDKNSNMPMYPASTTKILTAIIILEDLPLTELVTVDAESPYAGGSHIALEPGEQLTVEQLVFALLMASANDAAETLAVHHSGSIEAFAAVMNERAAEMGAINSNFVNPHGLTDTNHLTTAYDLAMIAKHAMTNETFRKIVMTTRYEIPATNMKNEIRYLNSTNSFYQGMKGSNDMINVHGKSVPIAYEYVTGIKRGYTDEAQSCLVTSATKEDKSYISVVLKSSGNGMYADTRMLLDYGLFGVVSHQLHAKDEVIESVNMNNNRKTVIPVVVEQNVVVDLVEGIDLTSLEKKVTMIQTIDLPVKKGEKLGTLSYYYGDELLTSVPIVSQDDFAGEDLVTEITHFFVTKERPLFSKSWFIFVITRLLVALLLWRTIITIIRIRQLKRRKARKRKSRTSVA